jgi:signal transduction histidine kinase
MQKKFISGTGFGLFICKNIIESHAGTIEILSRGIDQGSTVKVLIPL